MIAKIAKYLVYGETELPEQLPTNRDSLYFNKLIV